MVKACCNRLRAHRAAFFQNSLHAEPFTIYGEDLRNAKLLVYRFGRSNDEPRDSQPCILCAKFLADAGLKEVVYMKQGKIISADPRDLPKVSFDPIYMTDRHVRLYGDTKMTFQAA